jgi:16S rRNA (uracil1498-N3)-methyltransferase
MIRLYIPDSKNFASKEFIVGPFQFNYLINVMRVKLNQELLVFNPEVGEYKAKISQLDKKLCQICLIELTKAPKPTSKITLAFAIIKPNKLQQLVDMATQLGITDLQPLITDNVAIRSINVYKMQIWIIEALEQSGRIDFVNLHEACSLNNFLAKTAPQKIVCASEAENNKTLLKLDNLANVAHLMIGPEGGWSLNELKLMHDFDNISTVTLGPNILRAETAAATLISQYKLLTS